MPIRYRPFEAPDIPAARALWLQSEGVGLSDADAPEALAAYLRRNPGHSFVAEEGGALVGTILCGHDGHRGWLYYVAVDPALQGAGLGRRLVRQAEEWLGKQGILKHLQSRQIACDNRLMLRFIQDRSGYAVKQLISQISILIRMQRAPVTNGIKTTFYPGIGQRQAL